MKLPPAGVSYKIKNEIYYIFNDISINEKNIEDIVCVM